MSFAIDVSDDFGQITDWLNPVTVGITSVDRCLRRAIDTREAAVSDGKYLASDVAFHLDASEHPQRPAVGSTITDDDGDWVIISIARQTLANRWRCVCRQLWIDPTLTVTIQKATYTKSVTGAIEPAWSTVAEDVVAKIVIEAESVESMNSNRTTKQRASVYFTSSEELGSAHRIVGAEGEVLKVISWAGYDEIESLFKAECEVSRWPQS